MPFTHINHTGFSEQTGLSIVWLDTLLSFIYFIDKTKRIWNEYKEFISSLQPPQFQTVFNNIIILVGFKVRLVTVIYIREMSTT